MLSFQDIRFENISGVLVWAFFITVVVLYFKALGLAKSGELVVYCNWSDFLKSSVWVYAVPIGLVFVADDSADWFHILWDGFLLLQVYARSCVSFGGHFYIIQEA